MHDPTPTQPARFSPSLPLAQRILEIALIVLVFFIVGGEPTPHDNEAHYLCRLKHFWNPTWCEGDLFLESADAQVVFIWTLGWLTKWLSLPETAWVGRLLAWSLLAWAWQRLSWRLIPERFAAVLSAALFMTFNQQLQLAGEWVVGGVEAKCFAFVFVTLALRELLDEHWSRVWLLLGAASAFHPIVGGWSVVFCVGLWLLNRESPQSREGNWFAEKFTSLIRMLPALFAGGLLALLGVVPALQLTWGESPAIVDQANTIYVFDRLPHHLALLTLPHEEIVARISRHAALLAGLLVLGLASSQRSRLTSPFKNSGNVDDAATAPDFAGLRQIALFAWFAALLAVIGFVIELALWNQPAMAADLLRYYWFRMTDFAVPLAVALLLTAVLAAGMERRRAWAAFGLVLAVAACGNMLIDKSWRRHVNPIPLADKKMFSVDSWKDLCEWVAENTEPDALFLTPRLNQTFKWRTGRPEVVTRKDMPQDARSIAKWFERYQHIYFADGALSKDEPPPSLSQLGTDRVRQLAKEYGAKYVITGSGRPLWFTVIYPNVEYANEDYVVYRIDEPAQPVTKAATPE